MCFGGALLAPMFAAYRAPQQISHPSTLCSVAMCDRLVLREPNLSPNRLKGYVSPYKPTKLLSVVPETLERQSPLLLRLRIAMSVMSLHPIDLQH